VQPAPGPKYDERDYGYHDQYDRRDEQTSAWRKVLSRKLREETDTPAWEEEVVEYPSRAASYAPETYPLHAGRRRAPYAEEHLDPRAYAEDHYDYDRSSTSDPVPIVQRENSLTRMRDMFSDPSRASHAVTEIPLPGNRYTVTDFQSPVEVHHRDMHPSRHQPVIINNTPTHSVRPDTEHMQVLSERARGKRPEYSRRESSPDHYDTHPHESEYPPCVVVVERGRHGKPDTYYVIPGGAPVIFEDEHGKELTRVGDFSGRYKPQALKRPVIIQDEYGREVYRMGFDDDGASEDGYYSRSRVRDYDRHSSRNDYSRRSHSGSSRYESSRRYDERYDDHYSRSRHGSPKVYAPAESTSRHGSPRVYGPEGYSNSRHGSPRRYAPEEYRKSYNDDRHSIRRSEGTSRSSSPKVVYIDPSVQSDRGRSRGRSSSHATHTSSTRHERRDRDERTPHPADYNASTIHAQAPRSVHSSRRSASGSVSSAEMSHHSRN